MYKVAICDDESFFITELQNQVTNILQENGVDFDIMAFPSGEALLSHINEKSADFDMIFLDIFMKEINGIDTARAIRLINDSAAIIFTTVSDQYVFSGYEVQALQYLLKPVDKHALAAALMVDLKRRFENKYFVFKSGGMTNKVHYDDIEYFESVAKLVKLVAKPGVYEIYTRLSDIEESLPKTSFCRCHRGFIVNWKQVAKMNAQSIAIVGGHVVPIGKSYAKDTSRAFLNYIGAEV